MRKDQAIHRFKGKLENKFYDIANEVVGNVGGQKIISEDKPLKYMFGFKRKDLRQVFLSWERLIEKLKDSTGKNAIICWVTTPKVIFRVTNNCSFYTQFFIVNKDC